jgi:hypothetical protein
VNVDKPGIWYTVHGGTVHPNNRVAVVDNESEDVVFVLFLRLPNSKNTAKELASIEAKSTGGNGEFTSWVDISSVLTGKTSRA